ncbi:MAG: family 2 glycosyl transferase, partial [Merismopedia sp. SIO2A8]|nr:family 2 glycosyl transferase [Merismopedia sp. SIO2A8]
LKRDYLVTHGGWNEQQPCCQEHELYFRLLTAGGVFRYCDHAGSVYRLWSQNTVSRHNPLNVYKERLRIKERMYAFLQKSGQLTKPRLRAINQSRLDCARIIWNYNQHWATEIIANIHAVEPKFSLAHSSLPPLYKVLYYVFGFSAAETVAAWKRNLSGVPGTL